MPLTVEQLTAKLEDYRRDQTQHARMVDILEGAIQATSFWLTQAETPAPAEPPSPPDPDAPPSA